MTVCRLAMTFLVVCISVFGQTSFWTNSTTPSTISTDVGSVTLGLKFYSDVAGTVTAVRFYKSSRNTGTHVGNIWSSTGTKLASVTFTTETASGWQLATLSSPVSIAAQTTYIVSYSTSTGAYAHQQYYPWSSVDAGSLHVSGSSPGVFAYGSGSVFPGGAWNNSNYFVDVVFKPTSAGSSSDLSGIYTISGKVSGSSATITLSGAGSASTTTSSTGTYSFSGIKNGSYIVGLSQSGYTFTPPTASVTVNGTSVANVNFTAAAIPPAVSRTVSLSWNATKSPNIKGYNLYRANVAGGAFTRLNSSPLPSTAYVDSGVISGRTYYYVATAVDTNSQESDYSNQAMAIIP